MWPAIPFRLAVLVLAGMLLSDRAGAQPAATSFEELPGILTVGQRIVVSDAAGRRTTGVVADVTPQTIVVRRRDEFGATRTETFDSQSVAQIRRTDSLWNGILIGAGVGVGVTVGVARQRCGAADPECSANVGSRAGVILVPAAAAVGALIDRLIGNELVYRGSSRASASSVTIVPRVGRHGIGLSVNTRF